MSFIGKLKSDGFPQAVADGKFGNEKVRFLDFQLDDDATAGEHYCSTVYFGDVILETDRGKEFVQSVVVKAVNVDSVISAAGRERPWLRLCNEYLFYTEILPLLKECDDSGSITEMFPKFFFGRLASAHDGDDKHEFLVFENAQKRGFKLCKSKLFIDYNHLELIYRKMAQFHALSFICKQRHAREFEHISMKIQELFYTEEEIHDIGRVYQRAAKKSLSTLNEYPEDRKELASATQVIKDSFLSMGKVAAPDGPLTVLCHGDLQRNNIFFRYTFDTDEPLELMFFDFGLTRHSSPVIDLSIPLFTNALPKVRIKKWVHLLRLYHSTLISCPGLDPQAVPTFNDLMLDFRRRSFYGFGWGSLFICVSHDTIDESSAEKTGTNEQIDLVEKLMQVVDNAGDEAAVFLKESVKFMNDERFDFEYILNLKQRFSML